MCEICMLKYHKGLMKEIKAYISGEIYRIHGLEDKIVKMSILSKLTYRLNAKSN